MAKKEAQILKCIVCGKEFNAKRIDARFCSPNCRQKFIRGGEKLVPVVCKKTEMEKAMDTAREKIKEMQKQKRPQGNFIPPEGLGKVAALRWLREHNQTK